MAQSRHVIEIADIETSIEVQVDVHAQGCSLKLSRLLQTDQEAFFNRSGSKIPTADTGEPEEESLATLHTAEPTPADALPICLGEKGCTSSAAQQEPENTMPGKNTSLIKLLGSLRLAPEHRGARPTSVRFTSESDKTIADFRTWFEQNCPDMRSPSQSEIVNIALTVFKLCLTENCIRMSKKVGDDCKVSTP